MPEVHYQDIKDLREEIYNLEYKYEPLNNDKEKDFKEFLKENLRITLGRSNGCIEVKLLLKDGKDWITVSEDNYYVGQND